MYLLLLESKAVRDQNVKCLGENAEVCISAVCIPGHGLLCSRSQKIKMGEKTSSILFI